MTLYFSVPKNVKYLFPSYTPMNPLTLSNLIRKGFEPVKVLYEML